MLLFEREVGGGLDVGAHGIGLATLGSMGWGFIYWRWAVQSISELCSLQPSEMFIHFVFLELHC